MGYVYAKCYGLPFPPVPFLHCKYQLFENLKNLFYLLPILFLHLKLGSVILVQPGPVQVNIPPPQ